MAQNEIRFTTSSEEVFEALSRGATHEMEKIVRQERKVGRMESKQD